MGVPLRLSAATSGPSSPPRDSLQSSQSRGDSRFSFVAWILASDSENDVHKGDALMKRIKVYPLSNIAAVTGP